MNESATETAVSRTSTASQGTAVRDWHTGTLPFAAAILVALNALYIALVAFGNITDFDTNQAFVQHVLAMDTTNFGAKPGTNLDPDVMWRAITNETVQNVAYIVIIVWESLIALVLIAAVVSWIRERGTTYRTARSLSTIGLIMLLALFFGGFIAIGGEWFQMWKSTAWNGIDAAFRNSVLALATLILVHLPSSSWRGADED
jgi:predicted small integral membrane protein